MLDYLFIFLPFVVCLTGFIVFMFKRYKSFSQRYYTMTLLAMAMYFFADGIYVMPSPDYKVMVFADVMSQFVTPMIPAFFAIYISSLYHKLSYAEDVLVYFIPGLIMGLGAIFIYAMLGLDDSAAFLAAYDAGDTSAYDHQMYFLVKLWTNSIYSLVVVITIIIFLIYQGVVITREKYKPGSLVRFLFVKDATYSSKYLQSWLLLMFIVVSAIRLYFGRLYLIDHMALSSVLSVISALILALSIRVAFHYSITDGRMKDFLAYDRDKKVNPDPVVLLKFLHDVDDLDDVPLSRIILENNARRIYSLFKDEKFYLEADTSIGAAAKQLGLSRYTVKSTVASLCHCHFNDMVAFCKENWKEE